MKRAIFLLGLLLSLACLAAGGVSAATSVASPTTRMQPLEQEILQQLNTTRAARGLRAVVASTALQTAAIAHSRSMLVQGFFEHESFDGSPFSDRLKRYYPSAKFERWSVGENLLYTTGEVDAAGVIQAWLDSPGHRLNMLSPTWREVGIGVLHTSSAGGTFAGEPTLVVTMDLGARTGGIAAALRTAAPRPKVQQKVIVRWLPHNGASRGFTTPTTLS